MGLSSWTSEWRWRKGKSTTIGECLLCARNCTGTSSPLGVNHWVQGLGTGPEVPRASFSHLMKRHTPAPPSPISLPLGAVPTGPTFSELGSKGRHCSSTLWCSSSGGQGQDYRGDCRESWEKDSSQGWGWGWGTELVKTCQVPLRKADSLSGKQNKRSLRTLLHHNLRIHLRERGGANRTHSHSNTMELPLSKAGRLPDSVLGELWQNQRFMTCILIASCLDDWSSLYFHLPAK